jgi:HK97 family phage major capsid protein
MTDRQKLATQRAGLVKQAKSLHDLASHREWTPEESAKVDDIVAQIQALDTRLTSAEEAIAADPAEDVMADMPEPDPTATPVPDPTQQNNLARRIEKLEGLLVSNRRTAPVPLGSPAFVRDLDDRRLESDRRSALQGWCLGREATAQHRLAAQRTGLDLNNDRLVLKRAAQSTTSGAGGYTIPQGFLAELEKKLLYYNNLRNVSRVIRTDTGNPLPFPVTDDTGNPATVGAENTAPSETAMTFTQVLLGSYRYESLVLTSNELLRDSGLDLASEIGGMLGERIGRKETTDFTTGNGTTAPEGVVTGSSAGVTGATTTTITLANIMGLIGSLDYAYQQGASFMMHQAIWNTILQLADSQSRPLFLDLLNGNAPKLLGYPVVINNAMASSIAASAKTILFGDFSKHMIRDIGDIEIIRLNERYADKYQTGFLAINRCDAKVMQSSAIKRITQPAS